MRFYEFLASSPGILCLSSYIFYSESPPKPGVAVDQYLLAELTAMCGCRISSLSGDHCLYCASRPLTRAFGSSVFARPTHGKLKIMIKHTPLIDDDGEVRELTAADMRMFKLASEALPLAYGN